MSTDALKQIFDNGKPSGVHWLKQHAPVPEVAKLAKSKGMAFFHIEGKNIQKKEQFLNHVSMAMHFPDYFDHNWDAFEECITDLDWVDADGYVIYFDHTDGFANHHESQLETVIELFDDAVAYWKGEGNAMLVLLSSDTPRPEKKQRESKAEVEPVEDAIEDDDED